MYCLPLKHIAISQASGTYGHINHQPMLFYRVKYALLSYRGILQVLKLPSFRYCFVTQFQPTLCISICLALIQKPIQPL